MAREGTLVARRDKCVAACCQNGRGQERGGAGGPVERGGGSGELLDGCTICNSVMHV